MIKNKPWLMFPITNGSAWLVLSVALCADDMDYSIAALIALTHVLILDFGLIKQLRHISHKSVRIANIISSAGMLLIVLPAMFISLFVAGALFMMALWGGAFFILLMIKSHHPRASYGHVGIRQGGLNGKPFRNVGNDKIQEGLPLTLSGGGAAGFDDSTRSFGVNPANGMPMLETGFDMQGNVYGTNSADDFTHNRGFSHTDTLGFGLSDHHSIDISPSHDWHSHDISSDIHNNNHGINDY